jgi:glycosyltransferase involved in cell wall biosynthesis
LQKHTEKPVVSIVQWFFFDDWQHRYKLPFESMMRKRAVSYAKRHIIVQTNKMGDYFKELLPQAHVYKVPCGINQDALQTSDSVGDYALFLGRLDTQHKGLDDLLMAWDLLDKQGIPIPLWIIGAGQDEQALKALAKQLNIDHLVSFKGRLEGAAKQAVLKNCRFLVMPSRQETFGLTALEAMASSKPVIAYNIDHLNELLQPTWARQVKLGDIKALADAVQTLWCNPDTSLQLGRNGHEAAKSYLWDKLAEQQYEIYVKALRK